jgi:hypothetical protein
LIIIALIENIIAEIVEINFNTNLLFLFTMGFFFVSAGAFLYIKMISIIQIIILICMLNNIYLQIRGIPINVIIELIQHIQLFVACNPNPVALSTLKNNINIKASLKIPNIKEINNTTIILEIVI